MALTLRLSNEQQETLNKIQHASFNSTASGAIKFLIESYEFNVVEMNLDKKKIEELQKELMQLTNLVTRFIQADRQYKDLLSQMDEVIK